MTDTASPTPSSRLRARLRELWPVAWPRRSADRRRVLGGPLGLLAGLSLVLAAVVLLPRFPTLLGKDGRGVTLRPAASRPEPFSPGWRHDKPAVPDLTRGAGPSGRLVGAEDEPGAAWDRRIIRRATLEVEVADVEQTLTRLSAMVEAAGGFVAGTETRTDGAGTLGATITAYVPPDRFSQAMAELQPLGRVAVRRVSGQDVSEEFVDLEARLRNLERHESQLLGFMTRAHQVSDLITLENELSRIRGEIERLEGRRRFLKARTELATLQVTLTRVLVPLPATDTLDRVWAELSGALGEAWLGALRQLVATAVLAARLSPLAVGLLALWLGARRWLRRRATGPAIAAMP